MIVADIKGRAHEDPMGFALSAVDPVAAVRASFAEIRPRAYQFGLIFYDILFCLDPTLRGLFAPVDMARQSEQLVAAIDRVLDLADRPEELVRARRPLAARHAAIGVEGIHYATVGEALLKALAAMLGPERFAPELTQAWADLYRLIPEPLLEATCPAPAERAAA